MQINLNGKPCQVEGINTVQDLLERLELKGKLAVEINNEIVPRSHFQTHPVKPNDKIEIVHAIGGG